MSTPHDHDERTNDKEPAWGWWMIGVGLLVTLVLAGIAGVQFWFVQNYVPGTADSSVTKFGISGDFFGFANALFSALAFAMIIVTLWMQKYELKQQRRELDQTQEIMALQVKEMELQRQEMQDQRQEMQDQNESLRRQRFENTFFGMLELHNQVVSAINSSSGGPSGRGAFSMLMSTLHDLNSKQRTGENAARSLVELYEAWYSDIEASVGHYFRTLYNIIRFVHEFGGNDRSTYARLLRAQLSSHELELLALNGLSIHGRDKLKPLIEEYALLKHLRQMARKNSFCNDYHPSAFRRPESV